MQLRSFTVVVAPNEGVLFIVIMSSNNKTVLGSAQEVYLVLTINCSEFPAGQIFGKLKPILPGIANDVVPVHTNVPLIVNNCELMNRLAPPEGMN